MGSATASRCHLALLLVLVAAAPSLSLPAPVESVADDPAPASRSPVPPSPPSSISPAQMLDLIHYNPYLLAPPVNGYPAGFPLSAGLFPGLGGLGGLGALAGFGGLGGGFGGLGGLPGLGALSSLNVGGSVAVVNPNGTVSTYQITLTPVSTVPLDSHTAPGAAGSMTATGAASLPATVPASVPATAAASVAASMPVPVPTPAAAPAAADTMDVAVTPRSTMPAKVFESNEDREHPPRTDVEAEEFYKS